MKSEEAKIEISGIDFKALREQKLTLIALTSKVTTCRQNDHLEGLLCLIYAIQDYAVDSGQLTHFQVFGKNYDIPSKKSIS